MEDRLSLICHLRFLGAPIRHNSDLSWILPFDVLYGNMPDWSRWSPVYSLSRTQPWGGRGGTLGNWSTIFHSAWCLWIFSSCSVKETWQSLYFRHHYHLRQLKTGSSPPVALHHLTFWIGIGSSDNICRVILGVPVLFMPLRVQPMRNQLILHLTLPLRLLPIRPRLFHLCMQKRK